MTELALVLFAFALVAMAFVLGFIAGAFYIPRKSREAMRYAMDKAELTADQKRAMRDAIEQYARDTVKGAPA